MKKFLIVVALTFCFNNGYAEIIIDNEWARLTPNGMGAVYFEIKNTNTEDDFLIIKKLMLFFNNFFFNLFYSHIILWTID